jgi:hypothetical protein
MYLEHSEQRGGLPPHVLAHDKIPFTSGQWFDVGEDVSVREETRETVHFHWPEPLTLQEATTVLSGDLHLIGQNEQVTLLIACGLDNDGNLGHVAATGESRQPNEPDRPWDRIIHPSGDTWW